MCKIENRGKFAVMIIKIWNPGNKENNWDVLVTAYTSTYCQPSLPYLTLPCFDPIYSLHFMLNSLILHRYYTFINKISMASISISLSMHFGDADLCVSTYKSSNVSSSSGIVSGILKNGQGWGPVGDIESAMVLPTMQIATWRSMHYGNDSVQIEYDDPHFCSDCTYVVGVFGYMNSSYTILAVTSINQVIRLTVSEDALDCNTIIYYIALFCIMSYHHKMFHDVVHKFSVCHRFVGLIISLFLVCFEPSWICCTSHYVTSECILSSP